MTLSQIKRAYKLFRNPNADKAVVRYNVKAYLRSMAVLGDKWLLAKPVQRKTVCRAYN